MFSRIINRFAYLKIFDKIVFKVQPCNLMANYLFRQKVSRYPSVAIGKLLKYGAPGFVRVWVLEGEGSASLVRKQKSRTEYIFQGFSSAFKTLLASEVDESSIAARFWLVSNNRANDFYLLRSWVFISKSIWQDGDGNAWEVLWRRNSHW